MGLHLTDRGYGQELVYSIQATAYIDRETVEGLTNEQLARLEHHVEISRRVFAASVVGMVKGVQKYGPEPELHHDLRYSGAGVRAIGDYWLPHLFIEQIDGANDAGLFADALGVEL